MDPEAQFARLEDEVKEYLAMESLLREKKVLPERVRRNLDKSEDSGGKKKAKRTDSDQPSQSRSAPAEKEEKQGGDKEEEPPKRAKATG